MADIAFAIAELREGRPVRRSSWPGKQFIHVRNGEWLRRRAGWNCDVVFLGTREEIAAQDWLSFNGGDDDNTGL